MIVEHQIGDGSSDSSVSWQGSQVSVDETVHKLERRMGVHEANVNKRLEDLERAMQHTRAIETMKGSVHFLEEFRGHVEQQVNEGTTQDVIQLRETMEQFVGIGSMLAIWFGQRKGWPHPCQITFGMPDIRRSKHHHGRTVVQDHSQC